MSLISMILFSCENPISRIIEITQEDDTMATVSTYDIVYERFDSGYVQIKMVSPLMKRFSGQDPYDEFPQGFEITFFDNSGKETSFIKANYGISYEKRKFMLARNDVIVKNFETNENLYTENLTWDQRKKLIKSNTFVKLIMPDKTIFGDSMWANESFTTHEIYNVKGEFELEDDTLTRSE
ncbi:MAG: LPS export ABC transporter periplasmic protein LptC [Bacteroidetes bacterium]|nr:LPS export ABC transporter periplasmic protein LptC [Bacteroidota bacterium]MBL6943333.1 LPS export ABC transporter periplasmic protein LptC [Bacteroidales bacterium]